MRIAQLTLRFADHVAEADMLGVAHRAIAHLLATGNADGALAEITATTLVDPAPQPDWVHEETAALNEALAATHYPATPYETIAGDWVVIHSPRAWGARTVAAVLTRPSGQ